MPTTSSLCRAKAAYKKSPGILELTSTHLQWSAAGKHTHDLRIPNSKAASLFCSKESSPQVKLKLGLVGDDAGHTFMFTSPQALAEREAFKRELQTIIGMNRASAAPSEVATPAATQLQQSLPGRVAMSATSAPSASRATSVSSTGRASSSTPGGPAEDFRLRKKVLLKNAELASLHRELVMSGQITESEFWEGREHLLLAEAAQELQKRGRPGQLVDPRPEAVAGGDIKIVITPQLVHDIFEEYPVVAKAYNETVPRKLSEAEFWKRYFQSKLFERHRASIRSSASQYVIKDDPIFDKYVEEEDDGLEPRHRRDEEVELFVDLFATQEDHTETGNQKDLTMQAGKQKGALPLIRKFNEHSERLLNTAEGTLPKKRRLDEDTVYAQIDLEDLHDSQSSDGIILEMKDRNRYFDGRAAGAAEVDGETRPLLKSIMPETRSQLTDWARSLGNLKIDKKAGETVLQTMTQNVQQRLEVKMQKHDIPEAVFLQMRTCQTAANEFLRQFWSSVVPSSTDAVLSSVTPTQKAAKAAKAAKMAGYLAKTPEKIQAIIQLARNSGVDAAKIEIAMRPVSTAVEKALQSYHTRHKK